MERIKEWDFIKGVLIFCVIYGHVNAYITPSSVGEVFNYTPTLVIRLFQMPLFIMVSGLFCKEVDTISGYVKVWKKYFTRLVIPYLTWCLILSLTKDFGNGDYLSLTSDYRESLGLLWFIPMLLISHFVFTTYSLVLSKLNIFSRKSVLVLLLSHVIISMLVPKEICNYFFLFPFYIAGYFLKNVSIQTLLSSIREGGVFILLLVSFLICVAYPNSWTFYQCSNYVIGFSYTKIILVLLRYICYSIVTFTAILLLFQLYKAIENKGNNGLINHICRIGKDETLFLYLSHISILYYTLRVFVLNNEAELMGLTGNQFIRSYIVAVLLTTFLVVLLTLLCKLLSKTIITRKLFIGE